MAEKDLYRDTWVRYLGYANEAGESVRHYIGHRNVMISYGIATAYCFADGIDKTAKCYRDYRHASNRMSKTIYTAVDVLTWQMLASVIIPGYTINRVCFYTHKFLINQKIPPTTRKILVTATGLCIIPFIVHPIDRLVDFALDNTLRLIKP